MILIDELQGLTTQAKESAVARAIKAAEEDWARKIPQQLRYEAQAGNFLASILPPSGSYDPEAYLDRLRDLAIVHGFRVEMLRTLHGLSISWSPKE